MFVTRLFRTLPMMRLFNRVVALLLRRGVDISADFGGMKLLTVSGRKTGKLRTIPLMVFNWNDERWLLSTLGEVDWVRNLRAADRITLSAGRGEAPERIRVVEVPPAESARLLKDNLAAFPAVVRNNFDVAPDAPLAAFEREAVRHPTFRIISLLPPAPADLARVARGVASAT